MSVARFARRKNSVAPSKPLSAPKPPPSTRSTGPSMAWRRVLPPMERASSFTPRKLGRKRMAKASTAAADELVWKLLMRPVHSCAWNSFSIAMATIHANSEMTSCTKPRTKPTAAPPISNRKTKTSSAVTRAPLASSSVQGESELAPRNKGFGNHKPLASPAREKSVTAQRKKAVLTSPPSVADLRAQLVKRGMVAPTLSVVVPVKNEEDGILPFIERVGSILDNVAADGGWEILFVDDGSTDATLAAIVAANLSDARVRGLSLSRNFGKEAALTAGLDHARGAAVIPMDVDMQDPPEVLPEMVAKWRAGHEMVFGIRRSRAEDSFAKRVTAG